MPYPRKTRKRHENPGELRFLTFSCYQRLGLFGNDAIKDAFVDQLHRTQQERPFDLMAGVVMPEHVHLILLPHLPTFSVDLVLEHLKGCFANKLLKRWRQLEAPVLSRLRDSRGKLHFWQIGGGYDRNLNTPEEVEEKFHYTHENPVRRGLVLRAVDWRWSSARWYAGIDDGPGPVITAVQL